MPGYLHHGWNWLLLIDDQFSCRTVANRMVYGATVKPDAVGNAGALAGPTHCPANLFPANRIELGLGSEQQSIAGDRWRGQRHFVLRIDVQRLERCAGFHDVRRAFLVQAKDLAVVRPRRRGECPAAAIARQPALVTLFARLRVESCQDAQGCVWAPTISRPSSHR